MPWRKSGGGGQGESVLPKVLTGGKAVFTPPKFRSRRDSAWACFVKSHKGYITYYNFETTSVKFRFPLYMTGIGSRRTGPLQKHYKKVVPFQFTAMIHAFTHTHILIYYMCCARIHTFATIGPSPPLDCSSFLSSLNHAV